MTLNAANNYPGNTAVNGGTLAQGVDNALYANTATPGNVSVGAAKLDLAGHNLIINALNGSAASGSLVDNSVAGTATLTVGQGGGSGNFQGTIANSAGTVNLVKTGSGVQTLSGTSTYSGSTNISGGTLRLAPVVAPLAYTFATGAAVNSGALAVTTALGSTAPTFATTGGPHAGLGVATFTGGANSYIDITAASLPNLSSASNYTIGMWIKTTTAGSAFLYKGNLAWANADETFYLTSGVGNGGGGTGTHVGGVQFAGGWVGGNTAVNDGNWNFIAISRTGGISTMYVNGVADGTSNGMNLAEQGTQDIRLGWSPSNDGSAPFVGAISGAYVYSSALSATEIQQLMTVGGYGSLPATTAMNISSSGAALDLNGINQTVASLTGVAGTNIYLGGGTLTVGDSTPSTTFAGAISDAGGAGALTGGSLTKIGSGMLTLSAANNYSGATNVNAGTLALSGTANLGSSTSALNLGGGTLNLGTTSQTVGAVSISAAPATGNTIQNGSLTATSYAASNATGNAIVTANLLGTGAALTKSGAGTLTLSGTNGFTGGLTLGGAHPDTANDGIVTLANSSAAGSGTIVIAANNNGQSTLQLDGTAGPLTITNPISLSARIAATVGIENVAGANSLQGDITLQVGGSQYVIQSDAGTLTVGNIVQNQSGSRTLTVQGAGSTTIGGVYGPTSATNSAALVLAGAGTLTLSNASGNTYAGGTTISGGTLRVANSTGSATGGGAIALNAGTLASGTTGSGGNGAVSGTVSAVAGTIIAPGGFGTIGTLSAGGISTTTNATFNFDLGSPVSGGSYTGDLISLGAGTLNVASGTLITFDTGTNPSTPGDYRLFSGSNLGSTTLSNFTLPTPSVSTVHYSLTTTDEAGYIDLLVSLNSSDAQWNVNGGDGFYGTGSNWSPSALPNGQF